MANELTVTAALAFAKGNIASVSRTIASSLARDVSGNNFIYNIQTVGATEEALLLGDVATPGYVIMKNLDATNFVSVRHGTGGSNCIKLKAGDVALFRFAASAPFVIADTAPVQLEYYLVAD